jgi:hypothetical protein
MAINVTFGVCTAENEVVDKTDYITWEEDPTSCNMVNTDLLNPILKLDKYVKGINYVKIPYFGDRCYFVESYEGVAGTHCLLHCHVDVLHTYRNEILGLTCLVSRNEFEQDPDLPDNLIPIKCTNTFYDKQKHTGAIFTTSDIFSYYLVKIKA